MDGIRSHCPTVVGAIGTESLSTPQLTAARTWAHSSDARRRLTISRPRSMPLPSDPSLPMYVSRRRAKGHVYLYFRFRDVFRRLPDDPTSEAFRTEYAKALASTGAAIEVRIVRGSIRALIRDFKASPEWAALAPKTQADYARVLDVLAPIGDFQADNVRRQHVIKLRNKMKTAARTQDLFVQAVSRMFTIGMDLGYTDRNPAARIERLNDAESYLPWPKAAREAFEAAEMPKWLRTAYMLGLYTGQREGDVLRLARTRYDGAGFQIRQGRPEAKRGKGRKGRIVELYVPAIKMLREYLAGLSHKGLLFVAHDDGRPVKAHELQHAIRSLLDRLELHDYHFHGLRHTTGTAAAEAGATDRELMSLLGHLTEQMVGRYTKRADQKRLAQSAMKKIEDAGGL